MAGEIYATALSEVQARPTENAPAGTGALLGLLQGGEICISIYVWIRGR
jgi:hypothetical protein